jgi:hypothetical protein
MDILSQYILKFPHDQNILDLFTGEWSSTMPRADLKTEPGRAALFQDPRLQWAAQVLGGFKDSDVLELGPLEGGHSYMLHHMGTRRVLAIEANSRAFLKCLCIKEIFNLSTVRFMLGDFMSYLATSEDRFHTVLASGVLYHMLEPLVLLHYVAKVSEKMYLWTHYYDHDLISAQQNLAHKFKPQESIEYEGAYYEQAEQYYKDALEWSGFCGGPKPTSRWLTRESLLRALQDFGFRHIETAFEQPDHPNGPALALCAMK